MASHTATTASTPVVAVLSTNGESRCAVLGHTSAASSTRPARCESGGARRSFITHLNSDDVSLSRARTGGKCAPHYSRLDELTPVIFVATGGKQANYFAGNTGSTPLFFSNRTRNFAGTVLLAFRPTIWTSLGLS